MSKISQSQKEIMIKTLIGAGFKEESIINLRSNKLKLELINYLVTKKQQREELDQMSPEQLCELFEDIYSLDSAVTEEHINKEIIIDKCVINSDSPRPVDPEWTQYVLSKLNVDEIDGENPRLEGLRRVTELLMGEIIEEGSQLVSAPSIDNENRACARSWIVIRDTNGEIKRFEALADACPNNCVGDFSIYPVAMADTRAKGRCYRAALKLKRVVSAEEIGVTNEENNDNTKRDIASGQITAIRLLADRANVSITKLLDDLELPYTKVDGSNNAKLDSIKYSDALIVLNRLNEINNSKHVPSKLKTI